MPNSLENHTPAQMVGGMRVKAPTHHVPLKTADPAVEEDANAEDEGTMTDPKFEEFERMRRAEAAKKMHQDQEHTVPKHDFKNTNTGGQRNYNQPRQHNHMTYRGTGNE